MSNSSIQNASAEIAEAIKEAAKGVSNKVSTQISTERLLLATLKDVPPPHRIEDTIEIILEEEVVSEK